MIADPHHRRVRRRRLVRRRVMHDDMGLFTLNDMYRHVEHPRQRQYLRLAAPHGGVADVHAVRVELLRAHEPGVVGGGGKEGEKVVWVGLDVLGGGVAGEGVGGFGLGDDAEDGKLVGDGGVEAVDIWVDL